MSNNNNNITLIENLHDLQIELKTATEHGDFIEGQLYESNRLLKQEIKKSLKVEKRLSKLVHMLNLQTEDLEILIETITSHSDENDFEWIDKLNVAEAQSLIDPMTQIANRRKFDQYFEQEWNRAYRNKTPLSIIFMDIDHFKSYNDFYGHVQGDKCLIEIANVISQKVSRPGDVLCRFGGEEFAVILPETELAGAINLAENINKSVEQAEIQHESSPTSDFVTISLGVDSIIPDAKNARIFFLEHVDNLLYEAKQHGRNTIIGPKQCPELKAKEVKTYFDYISILENEKQETLNLSFIPNTISLSKRWGNNGLAADFMSDYIKTFFPVLEAKQTSIIRQAEITNAVAFIVNELLENIMKYTAVNCKLTCGVNLYIYPDRLVFYSTNFITEKNANIYKKFIEQLINIDPMELMIDRLEYNAIHDESSGLGYLTMLNDYQAILSWQFENNRMEYIKALARVEIVI
jgi:diguanylate cyclase (GGDEF)-like protein